jgi:hypothetical protein
MEKEKAMRRLLALALPMLLSLSVAHAADTLRVGSQVLMVGDSAVRAIQLLGDPAFKEPVENTFGAARGERWQYEIGTHVATVTIIGGRVASIEDRSR